jgi:uncharacterized protein (DUF1684 family)
MHEPGASVDNASPTWLDLYDWRGRVAALYRARAEALHRGADAAQVWQRFCAQKDDLFARHPQSPLSAAAHRHFAGLRYFPYDARLCIEARLEPAPDDAAPARDASGPHPMPLRRAARLRFALDGTPVQLFVYWIDVYGGGLFLPFRDATCGTESYGGGRYLFDTVKGSDVLRLGESVAQDGLGYGGGPVLLDFNYAYNPSCAYDARWVCPLAPPENRLAAPIRAGEQHFHA